MQLSELYLDRYLYRDNRQNLETKDSIFNSLDNSDSEPAPIRSGGAAMDINTSNTFINGALLEPGTIPQTTLDVSNWGWTQSCAFSSTDLDTVSWGAGTFTSAGGDSYSISAGNTGNMTAKTYIYLDLGTSETVYQTTTTSADAVGIGKVIIAVAEDGTTDATYNTTEANQIVADNILANTIDASKLNVGQLSAISANVGTLTSGNINGLTITGGTIQTATSGKRIKLTSTDSSKIQFLDGNTEYGLLEVRESSGEGQVRLVDPYNGSYGLYLSSTIGTGSNTMAYLNASGAQVSAGGSSTVYAAQLLVNSDYLGVYRTGGTNKIITNLKVASHWSPNGGGVYNLGDSTNTWDNVYSENLYCNNRVQTSLIPQSSVTYALGSSTRLWNAVWTGSLYLRTGQSNNPSTSGQINFYDATGGGFRGRIGTWLGQFDLTAK